MNKDDRIFIAGHRGLVGSAIRRALVANNYTNTIVRSRGELDLRDSAAVEAFFQEQAVDYVFLAAARVGGILANVRYGGDFIRDNLLIQTNVIDAAYRNGVKKLLFLGSSCIYPKHTKQPIREDSLLTGPLEPTNLPYAIAKIAGKTMCDAYRQQYGFNSFTVMPCNVYGVNDNFDPDNSHVAAGLMRRLYEGKVAAAPEVTAWGTGVASREFIDADDLADACIFLMQNYDDGGMINGGTGEEVTIRELTELLAEVVGYGGTIVWDHTKPDGTPRKVMDVSKIQAMGWRPKTPLREGLEKMFAHWLTPQGQTVLRTFTDG
ncbi:MAG: GDP-L-fucose synthase [Gammaproteobacteria bacterium]|nr:GDP-L-fucose synthase [Gammaproteobacteria bacterium]